MSHPLIKTNAFVRSAKKVVKRDRLLAQALQDTLTLLSEDAFHPSLKTHKLKGNLLGAWACSAAYDLRIVFEFVQNDDTECILLEAVGTHDEVY